MKQSDHYIPYKSSYPNRNDSHENKKDNYPGTREGSYHKYKGYSHTNDLSSKYGSVQTQSMFSNTKNDNNADDKSTKNTFNNNDKINKSNKYVPKTSLYAENKKETSNTYQKKPYYNNPKSKYGGYGRPQFNKDQPIDTIDDALNELHWKQNPNIKNLDSKMYDELEKFNRIVDFLISKPLNKKDKSNLFIEICKTFSQHALTESTNQNKKSSIYSIFFNNYSFKLSDPLGDAIIEIIDGSIETEKMTPIFNFFKALISISAKNAEMLDKDINLMQKISQFNPLLKKQVESLIKYVNDKKQSEKDSLESSISPTPQDLFFANKTIDNHQSKVWESFEDYKKTWIAITKENFYLPCRTNINKLREGTLDARDLFLYENVAINFSTDINDFSYFKDCNLFLKFQIRIPPNWKRDIPTPDWRHSERFANRSLLILSTDPNLIKFDAVCKSCAAARGDNEISNATIRLLNNKIVPVTVISGTIKDNQTYYMFEPTSSWSSVQPILQRLTKMRIDTFPQKFINIITKLDFSDNYEPEESDIPIDVLSLNNHFDFDYFDDEEMYSLNSFRMLNAEEIWPFDLYSDEKKDRRLRVDHEQYKAFKYALTHNLTLVNGAPGTGKTHLAREYLRVMSRVKNNNPIAIIAFTNHALDSILEDSLEFIKKDYIIRWGGPMRSDDKNLISRKWMNYYLEEHIQTERDEIVTKKQQLKNMYNIRQMAHIYIDRIKKYPSNIQNYKIVIQFLDHFLKTKEAFKAKFPIGFNQDELTRYQEYQRSTKEGIEHHSLPGYDDAINCWFYGKEYFENRNADLRRILEKNHKVIIMNDYENPFANLGSNKEEEEGGEEEEEAHENMKDDNKKNSETNSPSVENDKENRSSYESIVYSSENDDENEDFNKKEEEEDKKEEEDKLDENLYHDLDMIEEGITSYQNSRITDDIPEDYMEVLNEQFNKLLSGKNAYDSMIHFLSEIYSPLTKMINQYEDEISKLEVKFSENETESAGKYLSRMKLIGMTSTVASCRKEALERANVEIVIVEEAGELTESMISCILPKTMKRLILIGDYQQLRPKVEHEMTFEPYNYDISLFEKLVRAAKDKKADCLFTLSIQRRMHPQISQLVRNVFYTDGSEKITDDESTNKLGIPFGMSHRVRFFMHDFEIESTTARSYSNVGEAKYCAALIPFFICRGYKPRDITIIALYKGQKYEIEKQIDELFRYRDQKIDSMDLYDSLGNARSSRDFKVVVLDNFQGEENKIIIVSLTRSDKPGFIKNRNRALVTLSRAREMLVVLGNKKIFGKECQHNDLWKKISEEASKLSPYSMSTEETPGIVVNRCKIHRDSHSDTPAVLKTPEKIIQYRFSYCKEKCDFRLSCGHRCHLTCHCHSDQPCEEEHKDYYCPYRCENRCTKGHQCRGTCGQCSRHGCPKCKEIIHYVFPACKHEADIECYKVTEEIAVCHSKCGKKLNRCDHPCQLICGHRGPCDCSVNLESVCPNCNKTFKYKCGNQPECPRHCDFVLPCGHKCNNKCKECIKNGHNKHCQNPCNFVFACGHRCSCICGDKLPEHQHFLCKQKTMLPQMIGQSQTKEQECFEPIKYNMLEKNSCDICKKKWFNFNPLSSLRRCTCQCNKKCKICGKRCRAISGEKCAFFCPHSNELRNAKEPPKDQGPVFLFHDDHFILVSEAIEKVKNMYEEMILGKGDIPAPIHRLTCPVEGCQHKIPCLLDSLLFGSLNCDIEKTLGRIKNLSNDELEKKDIQGSECDKIYWYTCPECLHLFYFVTNDPLSIAIKCPKCGFQKGEVFE